MKPRIRYLGSYRWQGIPEQAYKPEEGTHFRDVTRQLLFGADAGLPCELRYFEIAAGGHSTLERHEHAHAVLVLRGGGRALVGEEIFDVRPFDLVRVPPETWHQLRAAEREPLGFLCLVACERDQPVRPGQAELEALSANPEIAGFVRT